jgi:hypothetical protein
MIGCPFAHQLSFVGNLQSEVLIGVAQSPIQLTLGLEEGLALMCVKVGVLQRVVGATLGCLEVWGGIRDLD